MKLIEKSEKKPLRIFTHVSENDNRRQRSRGNLSQLGDGQRAHGRGPKAKGYHYRYVFAKPPATATARSSSRRWPIRCLDVARLPAELARAFRAISVKSEK